MNCCLPPLRDTDRFFSSLAKLHRLRHKLFGFEHSQRQLLAGIKAAGVADLELLEIGSGPGYLHRHLLKRAGAKRAVGVDLSVQMVDEAKGLSREAGLSEQTDYVCGDFVAIAEQIADADVTILDKVLCCYPNVEVLLERSMGKTARIYALTYPRDRLVTRLGVGFIARVLSAMGSTFRPYVHDPGMIAAQIQEQGYAKVFERQTFVWLTQVYFCEP